MKEDGASSLPWTYGILTNLYCETRLVRGICVEMGGRYIVDGKEEIRETGDIFTLDVDPYNIATLREMVKRFPN